MIPEETASQFVPFIIYAVGVVVIVVSMLVLSHFLGQRHNERATGIVYEGGMEPTGTAKLRLYPRFYLVAMFFVVFDLESVYIFAWAVAVPELGWAGYASVLVFVLLLVAALAYIWRVGGLNFGPVMRMPKDAAERQPVVNTERSIIEQ
ncbi:MAG: NADH-quinone oxidoreductase subunit A [Acidobacteriota bacterium]